MYLCMYLNMYWEYCILCTYYAHTYLYKIIRTQEKERDNNVCTGRSYEREREGEVGKVGLGGGGFGNLTLMYYTGNGIPLSHYLPYPLISIL